MPEILASPPKRMTRARAAAKTAASDETVKVKATKASSAKAKAATAGTTSRPKVAASELEDIIMVEVEAPTKATMKKGGAVKVVNEVEGKDDNGKTARSTGTKGSLRGRKTPVQEIDEGEMTEVEVPKARGRARAVTLATENGKEEQTMAKSTRGRAKKAVTVAADAEDVIVVATRPTRARGTATGPTASTRSRAGTVKAAPKKKVTFKETPEQVDQENMPMITNVKEKQPAATGLKAKPVRKPASTRGRKPTSRPKIETHPDEGKPLSPKKVTQVAKSSSSVSSDDELSGGRTPSKALSKSPLKNSTSILGSIKNSPVRKLDFTPVMAPESPTKSSALSISVLTASPARRPQPSPFKDLMMESPKRGVVLAGSIAQPSFKASASPLKASLQESPKRGITLPESFGQSSSKASTSPSKASLLQSPARRPVSPQKWVATLISPSKPTLAMPDSSKKVNITTTPSSMRSPSKTFLVEPDTAITTHFRASPERSVKVHKMTDEELAKDLASPCTIGSPMEGIMMTSQLAVEQERRPVVDAEELEVDKGIFNTVQVPVTFSPAPQESEFQPTDPPVSAQSMCSKIPPSPAASTVSPTQFTNSIARKLRDEDEESEDELQSDSTPLNRFAMSSKTGLRNTLPPGQVTDLFARNFNSNTPGTTLGQRSTDLGITPLATQFSGWLASSPEKNQRKQASRGIFSPASAANPQSKMSPRLSTGSILKETPPKSSFFEDEMVMRELGEEIEELEVDGQDEFVLVQETENVEDDDLVNTQFSQISETSETYGDENELMPIDPLLLVQHPNSAPVVVSTPLRPEQQVLRVVHTVSKVPLKAAAEDSPVKITKKRSRSLSGSSSPRKGPPAPRLTRSISENLISQESTDGSILASGEIDDDVIHQSVLDLVSDDPNPSVWSAAASPMKTPSRNPNSQVLQGAVVYVDVHTTEGADASGIFVDLLAQMGARCVKQWNWNPRASISLPRKGSFDYDAAIEEAREASTPVGKVGITHVVFKDGGKRTLEKVRDTKGVVMCVGVGWVLDCERENKWLEESEYALDLSMLPRGGSRRRKSMEPRALANFNGSLVSFDGLTSKQPVTQSPTNDFHNPASTSTKSLRMPGSPTVLSPRENGQGPETPLRPEEYPLPMETPSLNSPTTPYYLSKGAQLVQQTCPPKQTGERLFPVSGRIEDQPDESVRQRLLLARRKSLQWAPRVNSPLGRINQA